jgi:putative transposase
VSDDHEGLNQSLGHYFPDAVHQRCQVHYLRNALSRVKSAEAEAAIKIGLKNVWSAPSRTEADRRARALISEFARTAPRVSEWLEETIAETLSFYILPESEARRRLRTTSTIEHHHAELRRRTRVIRIFPNEASFLRLATAFAAEQNDKWTERRFIVMNKPEYESVKRLKRSA